MTVPSVRKPPTPEKSPSSRLFLGACFKVQERVGGCGDVQGAGRLGPLGGGPGGEVGLALPGPEGTAARGFRWVVPPLPNFVHANLRPRAAGRRSAEVPVRPAGEVRKPLAPVFICNSRICIWGPPQSDFPPFSLNCEGSVNLTYFTY